MGLTPFPRTSGASGTKPLMLTSCLLSCAYPTAEPNISSAATNIIFFMPGKILFTFNVSCLALTPAEPVGGPHCIQAGYLMLYCTRPPALTTGCLALPVGPKRASCRGPCYSVRRSLCLRGSRWRRWRRAARPSGAAAVTHPLPLALFHLLKLHLLRVVQNGFDIQALGLHQLAHLGTPIILRHRRIVAQ